MTEIVEFNSKNARTYFKNQDTMKDVSFHSLFVFSVHFLVLLDPSVLRLGNQETSRISYLLTAQL